MSAFTPHPDVCAALWRETMLQEENDRLWEYFLLTVDFFAAVELHDKDTADAAHTALMELAQKIIEGHEAV